MNKFIIPGAWLTTIAAAFIAGQQISAPSENSRSANSGPDESTRPGRMERNSDSRAGSKGLRPTSEPIAISDREAAIKKIMLLTDPMERNTALVELLNSATTSEEFAAIITNFRSMDMTNERMGEYGLMLSAWAQVDPFGALEYSQENTGTPFARQTILTSWAAYDADAAIRWAEDNHDGDGANLWMVGVIRGIAPHDLDRASELLTALPRSQERGQAMESILRQLAAGDPQDAIDWSTSFTQDKDLRNYAITNLAGKIAKQDINAAVAWLDQMSTLDDARLKAVDEVTDVWARQDPQAAINYVSTLPEDEKGQAAEGIMRSLARSDPQTAESFLNSLQGTPDLDEATRNFVWGSYRERPELAANHIGQISDRRERERSYWRVLNNWNRKDKAAAVEWINNNPDVPKRVRDRLTRN